MNTISLLREGNRLADPGNQLELLQPKPHQREFEQALAASGLYRLRAVGIEILQVNVEKLMEAYNPAAAVGVMCRTTLSVDWEGNLYDCDCNQMLGLSVCPDLPQNIRQFDPETLAQRLTITGQHCHGCTAGAGSGCGGVIV